MANDPLDFLDSGKSSSDPLDFLGKDVSRAKSIRNALPKGFIRSGRRINPLNPSNYLPGIQEGREKILQEVLPTKEGGVEDILEFTGENLPVAATGGGGLLSKGIQSLGGGLARKAAKEMDLPEWAQEIAGVAGMVGPDVAKSISSKALRPSFKQAKVSEFLKSKGLSDQEITPLIQDKRKLDLFSKGAMKYDRENPFVKGIKDKLQSVYEDIRIKGKNTGYLEGPSLREFENGFYKKLDNVPEHYKHMIKKPVEHLIDNPIDYTALHDFNVAINDIVKGAQGGKAAVGIMKEPIKEAQKKLDPSLFLENEQTNHAYKQLHKFTDKMTQKNWMTLLNTGHMGTLLTGILTFNPLALKAAGSVAFGRYALKKMLTSPRLQNIHKKMQDAALKNNVPKAVKLMELFQKEVGIPPKEEDQS